MADIAHQRDTNEVFIPIFVRTVSDMMNAQTSHPHLNLKPLTALSRN